MQAGFPPPSPSFKPEAESGGFMFSKAAYFSQARKAESHANGTAGNFKVFQRYFLEDRCRIPREFLLEFAISAESTGLDPPGAESLAFASAAPPVPSSPAAHGRASLSHVSSTIKSSDTTKTFSIFTCKQPLWTQYYGLLGVKIC